MLWTVFKIFTVVWMLQLVFRFGGSAIQLVLVVSLAALLLRLGIPHTSFNAGGLHDSTKTGRPNSTKLSNSPATLKSIHRCTTEFKEQYP
jgi:hypothetical protein